MTTNALAIATMGKEEIDAIKAHCLRIAKSGLVPDHFKNSPEAIYTAIDMARVLGEEPVTFMQNVFFISGKAGMTAAYMNSRMRRRHVIKGTVRYVKTGSGADLAIRAVVRDAETDEMVEGPEVSMAMAKAEGWTKNAKYQSMPEVMLRARAITFLVRSHYPDVLMGFLTTEELEDMQPVRGHVVNGNAGSTIGLLTPSETIDAETGEVTSEAPAMREPGEEG
jgi:hypothetical protein